MIEGLILNLHTCRTGKHLANCVDFACPHHYKCQLSYCVPFKYTCDGKRDCPGGDDEQSCFTRNCTGLFKCKNTNICLHYHDVSDGKADCIEGDDEYFKNLSVIPCNI